MIGQEISHYKITEKLGEGGMGVVYKARDTKLDRDVALKFLPQSLTSTEEDHRRFIREAKSAAALSHPNICRIFNIDEYEGNPFIIMEHIEGKTLRSIIDRGDLIMKQALSYARKIAGALAEAHEQEIIHRDIKPENIMVDTKGCVKVLDFGLAKLKQGRDITKTGDTVGTLAYSSPEQIRGQQVDHRSDLFSLGIVFYEMLTGRKPFQGEHQAAMTYSIVNEEPEPLSNYLPDAPQELSQLFEKLLAKDPEDRMGSASMIIDRLKSHKEEVLETNTQHTHRETPFTDSSLQEKDNSSYQAGSSALPGQNFGNKALGRHGLLSGAVALLLLAFTMGWWIVSSETSPGENKPIIRERSVAVLPFTNLSGSKEVTSISRGLHDDLLTRLSNIGDLQVTSRTSVERYRGTDLSLPAIADSLRVKWIVEGSVQESGGLVQVNAQLIDPATDAHIWADSYQREFTAENLFAIQGEIAREIASALQAELSEGEQQRIAETPTQNLGAYKKYLKGRKLLHSATTNKQGFQAAEYFAQALKQDSSFALAWAGLADIIGEGLDEPQMLDSLNLPIVTQKEAVQRALNINPDLAEAHAAKGNYYFSELHNIPKSIKAYEKAIQLKPSYAEAQRGLGTVYLIMGKPEKALNHLELSEELNPQHRSARHLLGGALLLTGNHKEAIAESRRYQRLYPKHEYATLQELRFLHHLGRAEEAQKFASEKLPEPTHPRMAAWWNAWLISVHTAAGDTAKARKHFSRLRAGEITPYLRGRAYADLGDQDAAFSHFEDVESWGLESTYELRYGHTKGLAALKGNPRYEALIRKINESWGLNPDGSIPEEKETI